MKVLYLIDSLEGYGAEKSIVEIALHMEVITPVFVHLYKGETLKPLLLKRNISVYSLDTPSNRGYVEILKALIPIVEKEKPDIIHSTLYRANMVARRLKKKYPNILLVGSFVSNSYGKNRYSGLSLLSKINLFRIQCIDRWSSAKVDYFISNSHAIMKTNQKALGIPESRIKVIYRGRRFKDFECSSQSINAKKESLNIEDQTVFLNVSRLIKSKGQLDLLQSFKDFCEEYPNCILLIAGEGPLRIELEKEIKSLKLNKKVVLLGYRDDISELLAISDFFVFPSYYEGLPGALIEAIIAKKPSIVSDIPENKECFGDEGALYFPAGDTKLLTQKLTEAMKTTNWEEKVSTSFIHAENNFKIKPISQEYEQLYQKVLEKESTSP